MKSEVLVVLLFAGDPFLELRLFFAHTASLSAAVNVDEDNAVLHAEEEVGEGVRVVSFSFENVVDDVLL